MQQEKRQELVVPTLGSLTSRRGLQKVRVEYLPGLAGNHPGKNLLRQFNLRHSFGLEEFFKKNFSRVRGLTFGWYHRAILLMIVDYLNSEGIGLCHFENNADQGRFGKRRNEGEGADRTVTICLYN
jgi:hypothetical protein